MSSEMMKDNSLFCISAWTDLHHVVTEQRCRAGNRPAASHVCGGKSQQVSWQHYITTSSVIKRREKKARKGVCHTTHSSVHCCCFGSAVRAMMAADRRRTAETETEFSWLNISLKFRPTIRKRKKKVARTKNLTWRKQKFIIHSRLFSIIRRQGRLHWWIHNDEESKQTIQTSSETIHQRNRRH